MRLAELAPRAEELTAQRIPFVEAIVVRAQRPASVRPGAAAIVHADGTIEGFVGGACAETSVRLHSLRALETGEATLLQLRPDEGAEDTAREGVITAHNPCLSGGELEKGTAAVVVAAHGRDEEELLTAALRQGVPYVALVASPTRGEAVRGSLELPDELRAQLHTPAGLDIGARTPAEIAVSILAEIVAERHRAPAGTPAPPNVATDPVCGMEVAVTDASLSLEHDGERHYFCSEGCRERFAAEHALRG